MSEPTIHLTEAEFRAHLDEAFDSGSDAALDAISGLIDALRERAHPAVTRGTDRPATTNEQGADHE